jgi:hypothetical protein
MDEGSPYAVSDGSSLTDCVFSWTSKNLNCPIWLFGDSYFSWYPERWPYYLAKDGLTKACMLNGYAGEAVKDGMTALRNLLKVRVPQTVVWCLGMNNADNASSVNMEWYNAYTALVGLSEYYGFAPVLATVPSTPTVGNEYKNAIVRASGYRYIDFAAAVNTDANGSWISGALSQDNVHPTAAGAKILYGRVLTDLPEIASWGAKESSGGSLTVDGTLSGSSENPVQNKVVKAALDGKADIEDVPTRTSELTNDSGFLTQHQSLAAYRTAADQNTIDSGKLSTTGNAYRAVSIPMGQLDGTSTATVMTATVDGITELRDGVCVWLKNGVATSAAGVTLNINSLGAKPIYGSNAAATATSTAYNVNYTMLFVYNSTRVEGGCWDMVYGYDTNTTYTPVKLGFGYATCSTAEATTAKTASLSSYTLTTGGIVAVKFTNAVPAGSTLNINSKGAKAIYYRGEAITAGVIKAGDTVTMIYSTYYHVIAIDRAAPTRTSDLVNDSGYLTQHQDISGKLDKSQGVEHAGEFCVVGSDGNITTVTMQIWQGGSY